MVSKEERTGTTVYIPFVNIDDSGNEKGKVFKKCCEAVLRNFFAAINDGNLEVLVDFRDGEMFGENYIFECKQEQHRRTSLRIVSFTILRMTM